MARCINNRCRNLIILIAFLILSMKSASALWVNGEASITIKDADLDEVRVVAIKNAIADAAFKNGSYITAEDILLDGLLVSSKAQIRTQGRIQRVEILDETVKESTLTVRVKVDITPIFECANDRYTRGIVITQFQLLKPSQARAGNIFEFGRQVTQRFSQQLTNNEPKADPLLLNQSFMPVTKFNSIDHAQIAAKAGVLVRENHRQYVLFGFIRDISLFEQVKEGTFSDEVTLRRNFTLQVYLLDALLQDIVFENSYHSEGDWDFDYNETVDLNNSLFWRGDFGRVVLNTVNSAVTDVVNTMACLPSYVPVLNAQVEQITVALGRKHGVKTGDTFTLYNSPLPFLDEQMNYPQWRKNHQLLLEVKQASSRSSTLVPIDTSYPIHAKRYDIVSPEIQHSDDIFPTQTMPIGKEALPY